MTADLIIENARVLTMDAGKPHCEAVAVSGDRIVAVGSRTAVSGHKGKGTRVVDAGGATVIPGFVESHIHLFVGAAQLDNLSLAGLTGFGPVSDAIRARAASHPNEAVIMVEQAVYGQFGENVAITRQLLDQIVADRPLALYAGDHHTMWGNTAALRAAGLLGGGKVPPGNEIVMGDDGLASGELREFEAFAPLIALTPTGGREALGLLAREPDNATPAQREQDKAVLRKGLDYLARHGITSFHNMDGNAYQLELLQEIDDGEGLICRGRVPFRVLPGFDLAGLDAAAAWRTRWNSDRLKADFIKVFMDGVIEATNAFLLDDFGGMPGWKGSVYFEQDEFDAISIAADRLGFQIAVHAIGDAAVRRTLDGYAAAARVNGKRDSRHRVEHIEMLDPADLHRFAELGALCSMQPTHGPGSYFPAEPSVSLIGRERLKTACAWQTLRETGAEMVFSSDWPVAPLDPLTGIKVAMMREAIYPDEPVQRQSLLDALDGFTRAGAYAEFAENEKGVLMPGALADIAILSGDIQATRAEDIDSLHVAMTLCGGQVTFEA